MAARWFPVWLSFVALGGSLAFAEQKDPRAIQAHKDCLSGKVEGGIALLAELYAETKNPDWVYNQARCWEQNSRPTEAINSFREYLRVARNLSPEEKADVDRHMTECRELQAEQERKAASGSAAAPAGPVPTAARTPAPAPVPGAPGGNPEPPPVTAPASAPASPGLDLSAQSTPTDGAAEASPFYRKWWFWTGVGAVLVGTVAAIVLATRGGDACDGAQHACLGVQ
jgi:hypothetical protein